ncbi:MAG: phosphatidylglycerol lysyltransferase domain-containing protein [Treponema sp.]|jgi:hypothetical protein|nr:phosphatidylglycerol lysyltransferase domain-containing protein [Treponema sp.]
MSIVPSYPDFIPLDFSLKDTLHPRLSLTHDGISEFTFSGLYLFRNRYNYKISRFSGEENNGNGFIISGEQPCCSAESGKKFFLTPCCAPDWDILQELFAAHDYWKNISGSVLEPVQTKLEDKGIVFTEDRDNFDYLYYRKDLAELAGKKFHKKKNHVNNFINAYPNNELKPLNTRTVLDAAKILDKWLENANKNASLREDGDYKAAKEALDLFDVLPLKGTVFYIDDQPAAYCAGESIARGRMFAVHFEKAIEDYRGIYQFINKTFAASLPSFFTYINREQDLGDEGLRQAKMTYRPCDFVRKYKGVLS